jgi:hypothetical protein
MIGSRPRQVSSVELGDGRAEQVVGVDDPVAVALLGEKALAVRRVVSVQGVPGDH